MKLSIIIPAYNMEDYLGKCLDSVIGTAGDYEIIVVNDGSTDGTQAVAEAYRARQPALIRVIRTENGGLGAARNVGMDAARGEYLLFLDSDDYLAEGALPEMLDVLKQDLDMCIFDFVSVDPDGAVIQNMVGCDRTGAVSLEDYPPLLMQLPAACNKLCRRSLYIDNGIRFPGRVWFEDLRTVPKLYPFAEKIVAVRKPWYCYLMRPGSITNTRNTERNLEIIGAVDEIIDFYKAHGRYERFAAELEYLAYYNQFLTSSTRVNLADRTSGVQDALREDFVRKFPSYRDNPYIRASGLKHKLLTYLLMHRRYGAVHLLMRLNGRLRHRS